MTKTKRQLRAEAVERLNGMVLNTGSAIKKLAIALDVKWNPDNAPISMSKLQNRLRDLLTDDDTHESREGYEERMYDVPVSDCPYCGCDRVVIHEYNDLYERPHSYRVEHVDEKEAFNCDCFESYYGFDSIEKAVKHADMRDGEDANDDSAPDSDVRAEDVDSNDAKAMQDSREDLEADVRDLFWGDNMQRYARQKRYLDGSGIEVDESITTTNHEGHVTATTVMHLLDRQAAIIKAEQREWWGGVVAELQAKVDELTAERDYWKREVEVCMKSAYPPSHSPERSYNPDVMAYPDRNGCTTPSTLVSAMIDGLRDERSAQYMALLEELAGTKADLKECQGQLKTERNNFEQATGARDYWREKLSLVLHRLKELGCEVGGINDVPITVELPSDDEGLA